MTSFPTTGSVAGSLAAMAMAGTSLLVAPAPDGLFGAWLALTMLAIAINDARDYIIPDAVTASAAALALLRAGIGMADGEWVEVGSAAVRSCAVALPLLLLMVGYRRWRGRDGLGLGDVKLAAVAGLWLEWTTIFAVIELATLSALAAYVVAGRVRRRPLKATAFLPFGLFLAPAIWVGWLCETLLR